MDAGDQFPRVHTVHKRACGPFLNRETRREKDSHSAGFCARRSPFASAIFLLAASSKTARAHAAMPSGSSPVAS